MKGLNWAFPSLVLMDIKKKAYIMITLALIGGALFPIALKVAVDGGVNIYSFLFFAYLIATVASFLLVVATGKLSKLKRYVANPKEFIIIAISGFAFAGLIYYGIIYSEQFISATLATVVYRLQPLLMLPFIPLLLRERITKMQVVALSLGVIGIYIAVTGGNPFAFALGANSTIVLGLLAIVLVSTSAMVFFKRHTTDMECTMFIINSMSLPVAFLLFLYSGAHIPTLTPSMIAALLYMGIPMMTFVTYFYFRAFRTLKTTFVSNYYCLSPFITASVAAVLLSETIQPYYLVIAAMVGVGILIQSFDKKGGTYVSMNKSQVKSDRPIFDVTSAFLNTKCETIESTMKGSGRVLAVKLSCKVHEKLKATGSYDTAGRGKKIFFYTHSDRDLVSDEERRFLSEIMGTGDDETVLMCAGRPEESEQFFDMIGASQHNSDSS